jgi:hypothetical protein
VAEDRVTTNPICTLGDIYRAQLRLRKERAGAIASVYAKRALLTDDNFTDADSFLGENKHARDN